MQADPQAAVVWWLRARSLGDARADDQLRSHRSAPGYVWKVTLPAWIAQARAFMQEWGRYVRWTASILVAYLVLWASRSFRVRRLYRLYRRRWSRRQPFQ